MDLSQVLAGTSVAALFLAVALWRPSAARVILFVLFFASAIFNLTVTLSARDHVYLDMVAGPYVPALYRAFTLAFVVANPALFTILVVAYELAIACLILARGTAVKLALLGSACWLLAVWLFAPAEGIIFTAIAQIGAAIGCGLMLRRDFSASIPGVVVRTFRGRPDLKTA